MRYAAIEPSSDERQRRIRIRSSLPGRHRFWIAGLYRNTELERALARGLAPPSSSRSVSAHLVTGTLLVRAEKTLDVDTLLEQIEAVLLAFSASHGISLLELERRGRIRPLHLAHSHPAAAERCDSSRLFLTRWGRAPSDRAPIEREGKPQSGTREGGAQPPARWHTLDLRRLIEIFRTDPAWGLEGAEASARLLSYRPNELPRSEARSALRLLADQLKHLPVLLLAGSALLSCATGGVVDGAVILAVIAVNGAIGYVTESSAERTIAALTREGSAEAEVLRSGRALRVPTEQVVPGDVLWLASGGVVPADARLLESAHLSLDESALTGESQPVTKAATRLEDPDVPLAERSNMVYRGTLVTGGSGRALVVATGADTEVGRLQRMAGAVQHPETPLQRQLRELGERTMVIAAVACGGVFVAGMLRGYPLVQMLRTAVSLAVAAVPEGLPTVAITTLALGVRRMRERQVIVRRLDAIETLGSVQVLCFDKTGTITHNRMRVVRVATGLAELGISRGRACSGEGEVPALDGAELEWLIRAGALCSNVSLERGRGGALRWDGSPTERALVELAIEVGVDVPALRALYPRHATLERTEQRRWMASLHREAGGSGYLAVIKGSPSDVLERCTFALRHGEAVPLSADDRRAIREQNETLSGAALRVLGLGYRHHATEPACFDADLVWLGLAGLADPPREGLKELIGRFRAAGVRSVMLTGDQSATARAVAEQIGLGTGGELREMDSIALDTMDPELAAELVPQTRVFSRVSPHHKLRIVQQLQHSGLVVAMTGDGVNDCPALKAADIGVAMGGGRGPAAREVADVILETDDLHAMLDAIEQGRVIRADIRKAVRFILATNFSEILLTFLAVAAGYGEGMTPLQLLWINLVSDIFPELALALQPSEEDELSRPPRARGARMFSRQEFRHMAQEGGVLTLGALAAYTYAIHRYGVSARARALPFVTLTAAQLLHAFSIRSERHSIFEAHPSATNPYVSLAVGGGIGLTLLVQMLPATRKLFGSRPMPALDWLIAGFGAAGPLVANELAKSAHSAAASARPGPGSTRSAPG